MRSRTVLLATALVVATGMLAWRALKVPTIPIDVEAAPAAAGSAGSAEPSGARGASPTGTAVGPTGTAPAAAKTGVEVVFRNGPDAAARVDASARTTESLTTQLGARDAFQIVEAADELAERKATSAIPTLVAMDITKSPRSAPAVIESLGHLASSADTAERQTATDRLLALLTQERARKAPESAANILSLYTALGHTKEPRAATALEAELVDPSVALAAKTVIIEALVRLRQRSSRAALLTLQRELSTRVPADTFDGEVQRDLQVAIEKALHDVP